MIDYQQKIPNNVNLNTDKSLQRALEHWQPKFLDWWGDLGPVASQVKDVYLRTAVGVDAQGWADYGYVNMPDYRWGIFLADKVENRTIGFGDNIGKPVWNEVPGELRSQLRRIIVTQGDTEPASVEQQRLLSATCPSLYDLRNLFQVNVEEGRHLWAMVYLLHAYFGRDGREEAEELLFRHSGDYDNPRILETFNEPISDWLSFFMFTYFTDRDGKFQLKSLAESGFDPLSRTCKFMLTEEAHHMFVGETGIARIIKKTLETMQSLKTDDPDLLNKNGVIDLPLIQKYLNFWYSSSLDLFGSESSSNAAFSFANGIKGRPDEYSFEDHVCNNTTYSLDTPDGPKEIEYRNAINEITRNAYSKDCLIGIKRWNNLIRKSGFNFEFTLPSTKFRRSIGVWQDLNFNPSGEKVHSTVYAKMMSSWIPNENDKKFINSLMVRVDTPGKYASWISSPDRGINNQTTDFDYIRFN